MVERHTNCFDFPLDRCRWVMHGESFDVGDRTLHAVRPPVFDSPTTRGLYDPTTGVYWAVDSFATPLPDPHMGVADLDPEFWDFGMMLFALGAVSPWLSMADPVKFGAHVDLSQNLDITTSRPATPRSWRASSSSRRSPGSGSCRRSTPRRCPTSRCSTRSSPPRRWQRRRGRYRGGVATMVNGRRTAND